MTVGIRTPGHDGRNDGSTSARQGPSIVSVRMTAALRSSAEALARERGRSLSELIRGLVYDACEASAGPQAHSQSARTEGPLDIGADNATCQNCCHFDPERGLCAAHTYITKAHYPKCEDRFEARGEEEPTG